MALPEPLPTNLTVGDPLPPSLNEDRAALNQVIEEVEKRIPHPSGAATGDFLWWDGTAWITTTTRFFEGTGYPNGVVAAPIGSRYVDKEATDGIVEWVKATGGESNQGWIHAVGDSGWKAVGTTGNPQFFNTWANYPGGFNTAAFRKLNGIVHLKGLVSNNTSRANMIFALPVGFRPVGNMHVECHTSGAVNGDQSGVNIYSNGEVRGRAPSSGRIALDGISFPADN